MNNSETNILEYCANSFDTSNGSSKEVTVFPIAICVWELSVDVYNKNLLVYKIYLWK